MLEIRPSCELCEKPLPPESEEALICTYECTFCKHCVDTVLENVCPNCGGGFCPRPIRPKHSHRPGVGLAHQPASTQVVKTKFSEETIREFSQLLKAIPPAKR